MFEVCKMEWSEVTYMVERLANRLQGKSLWGVRRGGQVVAAMMSYHGCKLAHTFGSSDVIVDDIADTGRTLGATERFTAVLVVRKGCDPMPDHWIMMLNVKDYVWFPWETEQEHINFMNTHYTGKEEDKPPF